MSTIPYLTSLNAANELMMSHVWRYLPTSRHNAYVCSSGSKGYCALKETLQNGIPGHTLLIESSDLRDAESSEGQCCLVYISTMNEQPRWEYNKHIPPTTTHVNVYGNVTSTPSRFLEGCTLTTVDLSPLSQATVIHDGFLWGCTSLTSVDLSPLLQVTVIQGGFLVKCSALTSVDLGPLSQVTVIHDNFLWGCTGLTSVDLSPLSQVTEVWRAFLGDCTGLTSVDLGPLSRVTEVRGAFLEDCPQIAIIDNIPPLCADPPPGWLLKEDKWVRE